MKKLIFSLTLVLGISVNGFAQSVKRADVEKVKNEVVNNVKQTPQGTVYGVIKSTPQEYVVKTPLGTYNVEKKNGGFSFMGLFAKVESKKGSVYIVNSSLGKFKIDIKKCTITKL